MRALEKADAQGAGPERAKALNGAGILSRHLGDYSSAIASHEEALAIYEKIGDHCGVGTSLFNLGSAQQGKTPLDALTARRRYLDESLKIRRKIGDPYDLAASLHAVGRAAFYQGDEEVGIACHQESLDIRRDIGDQHGIAMSLISQGHIAMTQQDFDRARQCFEESLDIQRMIEDRKGEALSLHNLGFWACYQHEFGMARAYFQATMTIVSNIGGRQGISYCFGGFSELAFRENQWERSAVLESIGDALIEKIGITRMPDEQGGFERSVARLREMLGEKTFLAAWKRGRAMSLEQAIKYALESP